MTLYKDSYHCVNKSVYGKYGHNLSAEIFVEWLHHLWRIDIEYGNWQISFHLSAFSDMQTQKRNWDLIIQMNNLHPLSDNEIELFEIHGLLLSWINLFEWDQTNVLKDFLNLTIWNKCCNLFALPKRAVLKTCRLHSFFIQMHARKWCNNLASCKVARFILLHAQTTLCKGESIATFSTVKCAVFSVPRHLL